MSNDPMSRRQLFPALLAGVGSVAAVYLDLSEPARAQTKVSKQDAKYQDTPNNGNKCSACQYFEPPHTCRLVEGDISPDGWCSFFIKKS